MRPSARGWFKQRQDEAGEWRSRIAKSVHPRTHLHYHGTCLLCGRQVANKYDVFRVSTSSSARLVTISACTKEYQPRAHAAEHPLSHILETPLGSLRVSPQYNMHIYLHVYNHQGRWWHTIIIANTSHVAGLQLTPDDLSHATYCEGINTCMMYCIYVQTNIM